MTTVFIEKENRTVDTVAQGSARDLCASLGVNPETVLIVRDGTLVTEEDEMRGAARVELLSVISGG